MRPITASSVPNKWPKDTCTCGAIKMVRSGRCYACMTKWPDRFWDRVYKTDTCWLWTSQTDENGYGIVSYQKRSQKAHRVSWMMANGPIQNDLTIDHLCLVKNCVNPAHMEPVTFSENTRRRHERARVMARFVK